MGVPSTEGVGRKDGDPPGDLGRQPDEGEVDRFAADALEDEAAVEDVALASVDEAGAVLERDDRLVAWSEDAQGTERDGRGDDRRRRRCRRRETRADELGRAGGRNRRRHRGGGPGRRRGGHVEREDVSHHGAADLATLLVEGEGRDLRRRRRGAARPGGGAGRGGPPGRGRRLRASRPEAEREDDDEEGEESQEALAGRELAHRADLPAGAAAAARAPLAFRGSRTVRIGRREPGRK